MRGADAGAVLSASTQAWLDESLAPLEGGTLLDVHMHLGGTGEGSDCWVNPNMQSLTHPRSWLRMRIYSSAAGVELGGGQDRDWSDGVERLARGLPLASRHLFLAFDHRYRKDGTRDLEHSEFHVPNDWARDEAARQGVRFGWAASVHPYRADAVAELERCVANGARLVKWLPAAQGIDPLDEACAPFYAAAARLGIPLLVHVGDEKAVEAEADRGLGNPLRLRGPLDAGVMVVAAHCGSLGMSKDLDAEDAEPALSFELFLRLMDEPAYEGLLFGEISAVTQVNRFGGVLAELLRREDLHGRLVNGSDWPLPNVNVLYRIGPLRAAGLLDEADVQPLREVYDFNPLLFDLVLKLSLRDAKSGRSFAASVFLERDGWLLKGR
ncbi:MAG: putative TIM-barrel fold metal-dependent hydrolase [Planctomycetota bacterium]